MNYIKILTAITLFNGAACASELNYVESYSGTEISFVQRIDPTPTTKKDVGLSSDTLDKLDVSMKDDCIRTWIEGTVAYRMNA